MSQADRIDRAFRSVLGEATGGLSVAAMAEVWADWAVHLGSAPGKQLDLMHHAVDNWSRFDSACQGADDTIAPDHRFRNPGWDKPPFSVWRDGFLLAEEWVDAATTGVRGMSASHERAAGFMARQMLDAVSPANFWATNPEVLARIRDSGGRSLLDGVCNLARDTAGNGPAEAFEVGRNVAATTGTVVLRTHLMELIRYAPVTDTVHPDPVLIVPAWIMKYYILDLSPQNSLVRYLTEQGFVVYMISWRNPSPEDAGYGMEDYLRQGPMAALDTITKGTGATRVHAAGYCLGGTLLSIAAAAMARDGDDRLASMTLLAAQMDFTEAGELMLFINDAQVTLLEDMMWRHGGLDSSQMAGAFQMLRSNDLIWSRMQRRYMLGEAEFDNDMMAWNRDATRMPYRMHSEYLRQMFLENAFSVGKYEVDGHPVTPRDIAVPIFGVGTETDHVAPWRSVFKSGGLTRSEVTFALTSGGHNAGIVSEPGHKRRHYSLGQTRQGAHLLSADEWRETAIQHDGSWWQAWTAWLAAQQSEGHVAPHHTHEDLGAAPGTYVHQR